MGNSFIKRWIGLRNETMRKLFRIFTCLVSCFSQCIKNTKLFMRYNCWMLKEIHKSANAVHGSYKNILTLHPIWPFLEELNAEFTSLHIVTFIYSDIATLGSILDSQLNWESCKFQLARWSHGVVIFLARTHPPTYPPTRRVSLEAWILCGVPTLVWISDQIPSNVMCGVPPSGSKTS